MSSNLIFFDANKSFDYTFTLFALYWRADINGKFDGLFLEEMVRRIQKTLMICYKKCSGSEFHAPSELWDGRNGKCWDKGSGEE